ncbi:MAG: Hpt domain-containing protein [Lachnospiraceae bacterium]|uniref:Hpt domain-containing protein n=1 Tax=Candidatus Merdisoma sp. JLR.KK006 TaxID=3112626 RepID=UPI002FF43675|nr:Hpt domain-containing protein [Lachnospiraceae bacterium]
MTIRECYDAMGGNYADVEGRLRTEERIKKFVLRVLNDSSYDLLCTSMETRNMPEAFRAAHTIKGICQNLSLDRLYESSNDLAELLRNRDEYGADLEPALEKVKEDYQVTIDCIKRLD